MVAPKSTPNFGDVKIALTIVDISRKIAKTHNYKHMSFYDCSFTQRFPSRPLRQTTNQSRCKLTTYSGFDFIHIQIAA